MSLLGWSKQIFCTKRAAWVFAPLLLAGCSTLPLDHDPQDIGSVKGELLTFWVGENTFVYYPAPGNPLTYHLPKALAKQIGVTYIRPGLMFTDGGSIPKAVQGFAGLSPWGYGPAYIVHDWLFVAHRCLRLQRGADLKLVEAGQIKAFEAMTFRHSASILANIIEALIEKKAVARNGFAPSVVAGAVGSPIAEGLWNQPVCNIVPQNVQRGIEDALRSDPRAAGPSMAASGRSIREAPSAAGARAPAASPLRPVLAVRQVF